MVHNSGCSLYAPPKASQETDVCVYFKRTNVRRFLWHMLSIPAKCHLIYTNIPDVTHHTTHNTQQQQHKKDINRQPWHFHTIIIATENFKKQNINKTRIFNKITKKII